MGKSKHQGVAVPAHSPRHPKNAAEIQRVVEMIARDAQEQERQSRVRGNQANERPAKRDWYIAINGHDPESKRRYVVGPGPDHPLTRARQKGKIDATQFENANAYRLICTAAFQQGGGPGDSTQAMTIDGGKANYEALIDLSLGDAEAMQELTRINRQLGSVSASILLFVCYMEQEIGNAVRWATNDVADEDGRLAWFLVALDQLGRAILRLPPKSDKTNAQNAEIVHPFQKSA